MNKTKIDWCDMSWNPVTGCRHGCEYCYARNIAHRFGGRNNALTLKECGVLITKSGCYEVEDPIPNIRKGKVVAAPFPFAFEPTFHSYRLDQPEKTKKPQTIFVCSMADLFGDWVPDEWISAVFNSCRKAPQHRYLFLTKNPARYVRLASTLKLPAEPNFWYGVSAEQHDKAEAAFRHLPAGWRGFNFFLSAEPLHGAISITALATWPKWVILGAETGAGKNSHRPAQEWIADIVAQASARNIPVFMKESIREVWGDQIIQEYPWAMGDGDD